MVIWWDYNFIFITYINILYYFLVISFHPNLWWHFFVRSFCSFSCLHCEVLAKSAAWAAIRYAMMPASPCGGGGGRRTEQVGCMLVFSDWATLYLPDLARFRESFHQMDEWFTNDGENDSSWVYWCILTHWHVLLRWIIEYHARWHLGGSVGDMKQECMKGCYQSNPQWRSKS